MLTYRANAADFGAFLERNAGKVGYLIGTRGQTCTSTLIAKNRLIFANYQAMIDRYAAQWIGKVVADCMGVYEMFLSGGEWDKPLTAWKYSDVSTGTMWALAQSENLQHGLIGTLPKDSPHPIAVSYSGHVGFFYKGKVYQSSGHAYGLEITELSSTAHNHAWQYWYYLPYLDYGGEIMLQKGDKGLSVTYWQKSLLKAGYKLPTFGADSDYGAETEFATKTFQATAGLSATGIVDTNTFAYMCNVLQGISTGIAQAQLDAEIAKTLAIKVDLDATKIRIAAFTVDLTTTKNELTAATASDSAKKVELIKIASALDVLDSIRAKY